MSEWLLSSEIKPNFDGGLMRSLYLKGGIRVVKTKAQRNSIKYLYRYFSPNETTLCFVESDSIIYKLVNNPVSNTTTDADWEAININGVTAFKPVGSWESDNTPELLDTGAAGRNGEFYFVINQPTPLLVQFDGLFGGDEVNVVNGDMIISVGEKWTVVSNSVTWDSLNKPDVIVDYINGIVQAHGHSVSDITDLVDFMSDYIGRDEIADHTIPYDDVPYSDIPDVEFLRTFFYNKTEMATFLATLVDSGIVSFTDLLDTPSGYTGQSLKLLRVNQAENAVEFFTPALIPWKVVTTNQVVQGDTAYLANSVSKLEFTINSNDVNKSIKIACKNSGGWKIILSSPITVKFFGETIATSLESTDPSDSIELVNVATDLWQVVSCHGNIQYTN